MKIKYNYPAGNTEDYNNNNAKKTLKMVIVCTFFSESNFLLQGFMGVIAKRVCFSFMTI